MNRRGSCRSWSPAALLAGLLLAAQTPDLAAGPPPAAPPSGRWLTGHWLTGYVAGYERDLLPLGELNWKTMTDVTVARAVPRADGGLDLSFDLGPVEGPRWAQAVVQAAHAHGLRATLMLGGAGERDGFVGAASPAHRARFVRAVLDWAARAGFDGLDLDWEPLERSDEAGLLALAAGFRQARPGLTLSVPLPAVNANFAAEEARPSLAALAKTVDRVNIMSYDMAGDDEGWASWHAAALHGETAATPTSVDSSVRAYLAAGLPARKLGVGVGFFGQCFQGVTGPRQRGPFHITASDGDMGYARILHDYLKPALTHWDARAGVPYLGSASPQTRFGPQRCSYVSYDDERSVALKARYARQLGLGGMVVWTVAQGHLSSGPLPARDPLLAALRANF